MESTMNCNKLGEPFVLLNIKYVGSGYKWLYITDARGIHPFNEKGCLCEAFFNTLCC